MLRPILTGLALAVLGTLVIGCDSKDPAASNSSNPASPKTDASKTDSANKHFDFKEPNDQKGDTAVIETDQGNIKFEFLEDKAPKHVANFEKLADAGFYDGTAFHRAKPGFMLQGGDPNTRGSDVDSYGQGGPGWMVKDEFNDTKFDRGIVGMAKTAAPDSAGSQFYIVVGDANFLDNQYTAFGRVTSGMDVVDKLVQVPTVGAPSDRVVEISGTRVKSIHIVHPGGR